MPSAVELAADYVRMVRSNGPQYMLNVAQCYDPKGHHELDEIRWEVAELLPDYDWEDQGRSDQYHDLTFGAAILAIEAIYDEFTR
jgi:predicted hydrolase (HD superfamily)